MLKSFASEHSFFFSSRASARVSSLISKQTCQVISLIGKSFARFLGKLWVLQFNFVLLFGNLSVTFLWQSLQRGTHSPLSSLPPLEPGADSVGQPGCIQKVCFKASGLRVAAIRYLSRKMDKLRFEATSHLIRLARLGLGCLKPFNQSLSVSLSFMLTL